MRSERQRIDFEDIVVVLEEPDTDDGRSATRRCGRRTIIVRYTEYEDQILVRSVSATRSRLAP